MTHPIKKTLLGLGCAGTLAATAGAALPTTYNPGDFLVGFRQVGNTNSVVVDIGQIANFNIAQSFTVNLGTTLAAQYGSGWANDATVYFSLASTDSGDNTNFMTSPQYLTGLNVGPAKVWSRQTNTNSSILQNKINSLGTEFTNAGEVQANTDPQAYQNFMPGGKNDAGHASGNIAWGFFNPTSEGNFGQGTAGVELDTIKLVAGSPSLPGTELGDFQLSADGSMLNFTPNGVPEPSSYVALAVCAVLALFGFRMNKARKSSTKKQLA